MNCKTALRVGIIGYGRIGAEHARWLALASGVQAAAAYDPTVARRLLAAEAGLRVVDRLEDLLSDESIHALLVATPNNSHFEIAHEALLAGKHVMVEKPMTTELAHAKQLVESARRRKLVLSVFHNRRWDIDFLTVRRAIDEGVFGRVFNVESRLGQWASCVGSAVKEFRPNWRNEACFGGGGLFDWGSHFLDQLWQLMLPAKPIRVFAQLRGNVWTKECDDLARVCVDFNDGAVGIVEINTTTTRPLPRWHIDGTNGSASSPHSPEYDTNVWAQLMFTPFDGSRARELAPAPPGLGAVEIWERFAAACHGDAEPAVSAASVLTTMELIESARLSSATGRAIELPGS